MLLSSTAYGEAALCLKRYEYHQVHGLVPPPSKLSPRIRKGLWVHKALADHARGLSWQDAIMACVDWAVQHGVDISKANTIADECYELLHGYFNYYSDQWKVITVEEPIEAEVAPGLSIRATVDAIILEKNKLWLVEHKTTSDIPGAEWRAIDPQTALQVAACIISKKYFVHGIIFDYIWTQTPNIPRVLKSGNGFYASDLKAKTTSRAFSYAERDLRAQWTGTPADLDKYLHDAKVNLVSDGLFYQRYRVERPIDAIKETLKDLREVVRSIKQAERYGHYRRLNNILVCPRFCPYAHLCAAEYVRGGESSLRQLDFVREDFTDREAR